MKLIIKWSVHWKWLWQSGFPHSWTSTAILHNTFISGCLKALGGFFFFFFLCIFHPEEIIERRRLKGFWEEQQRLGMRILVFLQALGKRGCWHCEADFSLLFLTMLFWPVIAFLCRQYLEAFVCLGLFHILGTGTIFWFMQIFSD